MRKSAAVIALIAGLIATPGFTRPSIITTDVKTGIILSSNNIDVKQDPYLVGKLSLTFIALNDIMTGNLDPDLSLTMPDGQSQNFALLLRDATSSSLTSSLSMSFVAAQIAGSPNILRERMTALFRKIGMRATSIKTERTMQGAPIWSGYTTNRDIARLTTSLILTHGTYAKSLLPKSPTQGDFNWIYQNGMCLSLVKTEQSKRELITVIQGASSEDNCLSASNVALRHNDSRIQKAMR
jgi:D-alanyl-D-alanine carboxypeptidase